MAKYKVETARTYLKTVVIHAKSSEDAKIKAQGMTGRYRECVSIESINATAFGDNLYYARCDKTNDMFEVEHGK